MTAVCSICSTSNINIATCIFSTTSAHSYRQLIVTQLHQNHPALKVSMIIAHREHHWCLVLVCISYVKLCIFCIWCWLYKTPFWISPSMLTSCSFCYRKPHSSSGNSRITDRGTQHTKITLWITVFIYTIYAINRNKVKFYSTVLRITQGVCDSYSFSDTI